LSGGGITGELARTIDWSATPLGPAKDWPRSLQTVVSTILHSRHPMFLWWGPELIQFYNDAYLPSFGRGKHPGAMGQRGRDCWQETWPIMWPQIDDVMTRRGSSWNEDHLVPMFRNGRIEEVYWTYGYSPVFDDDGVVGGTLVLCTETTSRVVAERRTRTMRLLSEKSAWATDSSSLLQKAIEVIGDASHDIPFALFYCDEGTPGHPHLLGGVGFPDQATQAMADARARQILEDGIRQSKSAWSSAIDPSGLPGGPWPESPTTVYVAQLKKSRLGQPNGFTVFGLSPRLPFDDVYRDHLDQISAHTSLALSRVDALMVRSVVESEREKLLSDLEAAGRAKDEFLAMLGHELRNPLSPIVTALQLMKLRGDTGTSREQQVIQRQLDHVIRLVDDLLDVSRITRGKIELRRETVEIAAIIGQAVEMASMLLEQRAHRLSVEVEKQGLLWEGDPVRLAQVVANLLTNAARYTPHGGDIRIACRREDGELVLSVRDNGAGIPAELLPRIFDLFIQGKRNVDRAAGGLGLGLTLVKTLVNLHGGTVSAQSDGPGTGSEFVIRLPVPSLDGASGKRAAPHLDRSSSRGADCRRILLVDDNIDAADLLADALRSSGHEVEVANDPVEALEKARLVPPEVAILDIGLPVMDGYELAERLRTQPTLNGCRFIALTGYGQERDRSRSRAHDFANHFVKPVGVDVLLAAIAGCTPR
jgi:signal transduction histidine kinase/CheY-like chemotaxis protein